jgi:hypothetical protein
MKFHGGRQRNSQHPSLAPVEFRGQRWCLAGGSPHSSAAWHRRNKAMALGSMNEPLRKDSCEIGGSRSLPPQKEQGRCSLETAAPFKPTGAEARLCEYLIYRALGTEVRPKTIPAIDEVVAHIWRATECDPHTTGCTYACLALQARPQRA